MDKVFSHRSPPESSGEAAPLSTLEPSGNSEVKQPTEVKSPELSYFLALSQEFGTKIPADAV